MLSRYPFFLYLLEEEALGVLVRLGVEDRLGAVEVLLGVEGLDTLLPEDDRLFTAGVEGAV